MEPQQTASSIEATYSPLPAERISREKTTTAAPLTRPTIPEVRAQIPAEVTMRSLPLGLTTFLGAAALYCAAIAAILLAPWWPLQIGCATLAGMFIATIFVVGHDACHGGLTPHDSLNKLLGRIAFLPSWTPYTSWEFAHNRVHHSYTNLRGKDYAWAPFSKEEYDRLPGSRRRLERHYRSVWGFGSYYLIEYWLKHLMFPPNQERQEMKRSVTFALDLVLVFAFIVAQIWGLYAWSETLGPSERFWGPFTSFPTLLITVIVLPFLVWNWGMGVAIFQHHNHPRAVWYATREEWDFFAGQVESTVHAQMPRWIDWISAFIMQHTAHHVNSRIPFYRLSEAQRHLERAYRDEIIVEAWRFTAVGKTLARCKLYDYESHRWLNFKGRPTTEPNPAMSELHERGHRRVNGRAQNSTHTDAASLTGPRSPTSATQSS
jgi:omega-6 fatty acid desaturase (delta-12 desaturase)